MAEKTEVNKPNEFEEETFVETELVESTESFEQITVDDAEEKGKDQVDAKDEAITEPKRKKSSILGRLSTRKKKSKKMTKEEDIQVNEGKSDSNKMEVTDVKQQEEEVEEKTIEVEGKCEETVDEQQQEQPKEEEVQKEVEASETLDKAEGKKKKPGRLRRLSFSKMKKSKKSKKENADKEDNDNEDEKENTKPEENDGEDSDSGKVQNVQIECELPETADQSDNEAPTIQPITANIEDVDVIKKDGKNDEKEQANDSNPSYISTVAHMPVDIAQKALQTIKQVFKPVIIYIIKKHPHCFKNIIQENNKNNSCTQTQV